MMEKRKENIYFLIIALLLRVDKKGMWSIIFVLKINNI